MTRPPVDPDLVQAVANLSEVAERYRGAMRQVVTAARDRDDKLYYASERVAEDARQMIQLRAEKLGWKPEALMAVLLMAATLDPQLRRKPNLLDIERGLERARAPRPTALPTSGPERSPQSAAPRWPRRTRSPPRPGSNSSGCTSDGDGPKHAADRPPAGRPLDQAVEGLSLVRPHRGR